MYKIIVVEESGKEISQKNLFIFLVSRKKDISMNTYRMI
jgi:hypothetical protein